MAIHRIVPARELITDSLCMRKDSVSGSAFLNYIPKKVGPSKMNRDAKLTAVHVTRVQYKRPLHKNPFQS